MEKHKIPLSEDDPDYIECPRCYKPLAAHGGDAGQFCSNPECDYWCWCKVVKRLKKVE